MARNLADRMLRIGQMAKKSDTPKVRITLTEWMKALEDCCLEAGIEFSEGRWTERESNLDEMLSRHRALGGGVFRLYGDMLSRTLRRNPRDYKPGAVVVRNVHLVLNTVDWTPLRRLFGLFLEGLYFEECTVEMTRGSDVLGLEFADRVCFRKTLFDSATAYAGTRPEFRAVSARWLVNLRREGAVAFEQCRFGNGVVNIRAVVNVRTVVDSEDGAVGTGEPDGNEDDQVDGQMSSSPESETGGEGVLLATGKVTKHALGRITLVGNEIGNVCVESVTRELVVRGGNRLASVQLLQLRGGEGALPTGVSLGLFEEIDAAFRDPMGHRGMFLQLKRLGADCKDDALVRAAGAQVDRIEHRLEKDDPVTLSSGWHAYVSHLQRRSILGWGYWVSNFNRSWARCLFWLLSWYVATTFIACWAVWPHLDADAVLSVVARPLHQVPFLARAVEEHVGGAWETVPTTARAWVNGVGLVQSAVTALLSFSLIRSLRR